MPAMTVKPRTARESKRNRRERAGQILAELARLYPDAATELDFETPFQCLIATLLSAQATDVSVNLATPALFAAYPDAHALAAATPEEVEPYIRTIGLFRSKAKSIHEAMTAVVERFDGRVPDTMEDLLTLRGVARKTANVVLGNAYGINVGMPVDTHIQRLSWRWGLVPEPKMDPVFIEKRLLSLFPRERWCMIGHQIIFHGRQACTARPNCPHDHPICLKFGVNCPKC